MSKKAELVGVIGLLLAIFTLIFGDNIYQQITGHSIFSTPEIVTTVVLSLASTEFPSPILEPTSIPTSTPLPLEINDSFGVLMHLVPAGIFIMGRDADIALAECEKYRSGCQDWWFIREEPPHEVYLDSFYIDEYEVTNIIYEACVLDGVCDLPGNTIHYNNPKYAEHPVVYIDWSMANTYCKWREGGLPSEAQWEKASRGIDARTFPWGESIDCNKANYSDNSESFCFGDTAEVGSFADGVSPYGLYDLGGNVWEWVGDWFSETYYQNSPSSNPLGPISGQYRVLRGGSWNNNVNNVRVSDRYRQDPSYVANDVGFRCVRSP